LQSGGPSFITFTSPNVLNINPGLLDVGAYSVTSIVSDGSLSTSYPIGVSITNTAPTFVSNPGSISAIYLSNSNIVNYNLPGINDLEGHIVTISLSPALIWYSATTSVLTMSLSSLLVGNKYPLTITLTDTFDTSTY
jgi:hypothetical protein